MPDLLGKTLGQYHILEQIGRGGMATVYQAMQTSLQRIVAVKVLPSFFMHDETQRARFAQEARAIAQLSHPHILPVYDFGETADAIYIVMECVTGGTLKNKLGQPLPLSFIVPMLEQVASALDYAHAHGIVHRDVKPGNVLLRADSEVALLADFGLAKMIESAEALTRSGTAVGTPDYMAPEQGQGLPVDGRTDIYALGVILFELLTGRVPYTAENATAVVIKHIVAPVPSVCELVPALSPQIDELIAKALAKKREERFQTGAELIAALRRIITSDSVPSTPLTPAPPISLPTSPIQPPTTQPTITSPNRPPYLTGFVGREAELAHFAHQLATTQLAIITGMAGVGKTALAAMLASRLGTPERIFWYSFHADEGANVLIWELASFLAWHGQVELWQQLQGAQHAGGQPPPPQMLLDYLSQKLAGQGFVLCLDDFQFVEDDPLLKQFIQRLRQVMPTSPVALIITSRHAPEFAQTSEFAPLTGFSLAEAQALLAQRQLTLPPDLIGELYARTEGNAQFLTLAIDALRRSPNPQRFITYLSEADDIERYLLKEIDAGLTTDERSVMSAVAALLGYPGTRAAISAMLDVSGLRRSLGDLSNRYLLTVSDGAMGKEYGQHAIVQVFYYDQLSRRERAEMHRRAGEFYEKEEPDALKAARHCVHAGDHAHAAQLATQDVWAIINQGQARALRQLLEQFTAPQLDTPLWITVHIARGELYDLLGASQLSRASYDAALAQLEALPDAPPVRERKARVCRGLGELLRTQAPREALVWLERGQALIAGLNSVEEAFLQIRLGMVQVALSDHAAAVQALETGLAQLPDSASEWRARAFMNLAITYAKQGELAKARTDFLRVQTLYQQAHNHWGLAGLGQNLGTLLVLMGDWAHAHVEYQAALDLANRLGRPQIQVGVALNLGVLHLKCGDLSAAQTQFTQGLALARQFNLRRSLVGFQASLAELQGRLGVWEAMLEYLREGESLANELGTQDQLPELYRGWAQLRLAHNQLNEALDYAQRAVKLSHELKLALEEGMSQRVLGQVLWTQGQYAPANVACEQSLGLLADRDPYETARTQAQYGRCLIAQGDAERGAQLLRDARATFESLGAQWDLAQLDGAAISSD